jgi:hypothetical protein
MTKIEDDRPCDHCAKQPELRICDGCGVSAMITDCGHKGQPRPIAGDGIDMLCDSCAEKHHD